MIIRAHQFVDHGYKIMHGGQLVTVFSARNYLGTCSKEQQSSLDSHSTRTHLQFEDWALPLENDLL